MKSKPASTKTSDKLAETVNNPVHTGFTPKVSDSVK